MRKTHTRIHLTRVHIAAIVLASIALSCIGFLLYWSEKQEALRHSTDEIGAIGKLKVQQVSAWYAERLSDARFIFNSAHIAEETEELLRDPSAVTRRRPLAWMQSMFRNNHYVSMRLFRPGGDAMLAIPDSAANRVLTLSEHIENAAKRRSIVLNDLSLRLTGEIRMDFLIPVFRRGGDSALVGVYVLTIDPARELYDIIQSWPIPSSTAECLLVRRERDSVLFLNSLRFKSDAALRMRFALDNDELPASHAVRGDEGVFNGVDYRGIPVLASLHSVPGTPWFLVAKVDKSELFSRLRRDAGYLFLLVLAMSIGIAAVVRTIVAQQRIAFYQKEMDAQREKEALLERLDTLLRNANDAIWSLDENLNFTEVNDRALAMYGYTREEFLRLSIRDIRAPESMDTPWHDTQPALITGGHRLEEMHRRKDGSLFPVEISVRSIVLHGKTVFLTIALDITERKEAEEAEREKSLQLRLMTRRLSEVEEIARKSIAQELHDDVGQNLTAIIINLNLVLSQLTAENRAVVGPRLLDSLALVEATVDRTRTIMAALRPAMLDDYGVLPAVRWFAGTLQKRFGIDIVVSGTEAGPRFPQTVETALFRIAQEVLHNVIKHAEARHVRVDFVSDTTGCILTITDDGTGFDASRIEKSPEKRGWGLITMKERAEAIDGSFAIESRQPGGTRVTIAFKR